MHHRPVVLSPATPSELLDYVLASHRHPTTLLICWSRKQFVGALVQDVAGQGQDDQHPRHALLRAPLMQVAVSRHVAMAFVPTVTHLRAYLAAFFVGESGVPPPPAVCPPPSPGHPPPLLLVYGFLELHRDGTEWSAQGLNTSVAGLVESAARNALRAAVVEPRKTESREELRALLDETVPILNESKARDDGIWSSQLVPVRRVFGRWFEFEATGDNAGGADA